MLQVFQIKMVNIDALFRSYKKTIRLQIVWKFHEKDLIYY